MQNDKRVQKTVKCISDAFLELSRTKDYKTITVTELCNKANINRCTFYAHYADIYDFLNSLEMSMVDSIIAIMSEYEYDTDGHQVLSTFVNYIVDNSDKLFLLFSDSSPGSSLDRIYSVMKEKALPIWKEESYLHTDQLEMLFSYMIRGTFALIKQWYESGFVTDKEKVKVLLENIVKYGLYTYVYTK